MPVIIEYKDLTIEYFDDPAFTEKPDSPTNYDKVYQLEKDKVYVPVSQHGIIVYRDDVKLASAILLACAGATSATADAIVIVNDLIVTRCCNVVFSLSLPNLELNWATEVDWATCFSIRLYKGDYITHGELSIARVDRNGNIIWKFSGADIFVCLNEGYPFQMFEDYISLTDFNGTTYKIDYDGKEIG